MENITRRLLALAGLLLALGQANPPAAQAQGQVQAQAQAQGQLAPRVSDPAQADPGYAARKLQRHLTGTGTGTVAQPGPPTARRSVNPPGTPLPACFEPLDKATYTPVPRNDDGSLGPIALGFDFFLFGTAYNSVYINTNGNITFNAPFSGFVPSGFPIATPMVAAFWNDVDTRTPTAGDRGQAWYRLFNDRLVVTWDSVGRFSNLTDFKNTFQIKLFANAGGVLDEDVQFAYGDMQWATATGFSGGGFGGPGTTVGVNEGGGGGRFIQTGRFALDGAAYVDNTSDSGVDYLDYKCIGFRVFDAGNQPPAVSGLPFGGSITVNQGQAVRLNPVFTGPEVGQTVTVAVADGVPCNSTASTSAGANPTVRYTVTGAACNVGTHTVTFTATDNGNPVRSSVFALTVVVNPPLTAATWDGDVSTDYLTPANWVGDVQPQPADSVLIPGTAPRFPVLTGDARAGNFRVAAGASMGVAAGASLALRGYLFSGGPVGGDGEIALQGSNQQAVGGPAPVRIGTLAVGPAGAALRGPLAVGRVLDLTGSLNTSGFGCVLTSDALGTAMVVNRGSGRVVGNATVQRYLNPGPNPGLGYRHLSAPVDGQTVQSLAGPLFQPVVNAAYNTLGNTVSPFPNIYSYDQGRLGQGGLAGAVGFDLGWRCPATAAAPLAEAQGYTVNMAATSPLNLAYTLGFTGTLHNGNYPSGPLPRGPEAAAGWHLLGNPYPAPIDWLAAFAGATGLEDAVYVFKSTGQYAGSYEAFVNGIGPARYIGSGQGFFVRTEAGQTGRLNLTNAARVSAYQNPDVRRAAAAAAATTPTAADPRPQLRLELAGATGPTETAHVYFEAGATPGFDARYDAHKVPGGEALYLASGTSGADALSISGLPPLAATGRAVPLLVYLPRPGTYALRLAALHHLPAATAVLLEDRLTGRWHDLRRQPAYAFGSASTDAGRRFVLHLGPQATALATSRLMLPAEAVALWPNPATGTAHLAVALPGKAETLHLTLLNPLGQPVRTLAVPVLRGTAAATLDVNGLAPGLYVVRGQASTASFSRSLVVR